MPLSKELKEIRDWIAHAGMDTRYSDVLANANKTENMVGFKFLL